MYQLRQHLVQLAGIGVILSVDCGRASDRPRADPTQQHVTAGEPAGLHARFAGCYFVRAMQNVEPADRASFVAMAPIFADSVEEHDARGTVHRLAWHRTDQGDRRVGSWFADGNSAEMFWVMTNGFGGVVYRGIRADSTFTAEARSAGDIPPYSEDLGTITFVRRACPRAMIVWSEPMARPTRRPSNDR